ncbi:estrogen sulfotransferase-like [Anoplophora glabripennis]|uniref:estrogen sulfotransferase-like n=1 Tax=Anoplophora glabripennis TaxID=217634 RepID=UPI00087489A1|nr:estrogen sulfotransferase-like [Anoplophora glabripennis]
MSIKKFPFEIRPLQPELDEKIKSLFLGAKEGSVEIGPKKYIFRSEYGQAAETIYNFQVRPDDVWVVTFLRSGTTLMQEIAWLILNDDYDAAKNVSLFKRFPFLEISTLRPDHVLAEIKEDMRNDKKLWEDYKESVRPQWEVLENTVGRRFIKSHLPLSLLPPTLLTSGAKVIYVARNPKNAAVSRYHQDRSLRTVSYIGNFEQYWDLFEKNLIYFTPYWEHLEEAWQQRSNKNLSFFFFEDVIKDYKKAIVEVSNFLEKTMSDEQISKLADYLRIDNFRKRDQLKLNSMLNIISARDPYQHVRTGKSGDWDEYFTQELEARANKWIEENYKNTTLRFPVKLY